MSLEYTKWLVDNGFTIVRYLSVASQLRQEVALQDETSLSDTQKDAIAAFDTAYANTQLAFDAAADSMAKNDTIIMADAGKELCKKGDELYNLFDNAEKPVWRTNIYWYADRMINEIDVNFR